MPTTRWSPLQLAALTCRFDAVVHFAGRKAVGESVEFPMLYYTHNVVGTVNLIEAMRKHGIKNVSPARLTLSSVSMRTYDATPQLPDPGATAHCTQLCCWAQQEVLCCQPGHRSD